MKNRRHVLHLLLITHISETTHILEAPLIPKCLDTPPLYNEEDMVMAITSKDKIVSEIESINKECISPKEYGIKKLGKYDIRRIKK